MLSHLLRRAEFRNEPAFIQLARGLGAYGSAELAARLVRLFTTVVIARQLAPEIVGQAALALTVFELVRVLERTGTGQQIVRASEDQLAATCNTVLRFYRGWTGFLLAAQLAAAAVLGLALHQPLAAVMLGVLALVYPFMAGGHVSFFLAMRAGRTGPLARIGAVQATADQVLTAILLLVWPSPWAIVLPKLATAPLWMVMARRAAPWRSDAAAGTLPLGEVLRYAGPVLLADGMTALRTQGDNLIIAAMLGTSALGTYFFAFNAGLGIVSSLIGALGSVAFPMLCAAPRGTERAAVMRRVIIGGLLVFVPFVLLQSLAAPLYVPLVFGAHWAFAAPLIAVLCFAGLPVLITQFAGCWLRAEGRVARDAAASFAACLTTLGGLVIGAACGGLMGAVIGLVTGQSLCALLNAANLIFPVFHFASKSSLQESPIHETA